MRKVKLTFLSLLALGTMSLASCTGAQGEKGDKGDQGDQGPQGEPGENGEDGEDGSLWYTGEGVPSAELGKVGDMYLDTSTNNVYQKETSGWILKTNIQGDPGQDGDDGEDGRPGSSGSNGKTAWSNTILPSNGGFISVNKGSAIESEEVVFTIYVEDEYVLNSFILNGVRVEDSPILSDTENGVVYTYETEMVKNGFVVSADFITKPQNGEPEYVDGIQYSYVIKDGYGNIVEKGDIQSSSIVFDDGSGSKGDPFVLTEEQVSSPDTLKSILCNETLAANNNYVTFTNEAGEVVTLLCLKAKTGAENDGELVETYEIHNVDALNQISEFNEYVPTAKYFVDDNGYILSAEAAKKVIQNGEEYEYQISDFNDLYYAESLQEIYDKSGLKLNIIPPQDNNLILTDDLSLDKVESSSYGSTINNLFSSFDETTPITIDLNNNELSIKNGVQINQTDPYGFVDNDFNIKNGTILHNDYFASTLRFDHQKTLGGSYTFENVDFNKGETSIYSGNFQIYINPKEDIELIYTFKGCNFKDFGISFENTSRSKNVTLNISFIDCTFNGTNIGDGGSLVNIDGNFNNGVFKFNNCNFNGTVTGNGASGIKLDDKSGSLSGLTSKIIINDCNFELSHVENRNVYPINDSYYCCKLTVEEKGTNTYKVNGKNTNWEGKVLN